MKELGNTPADKDYKPNGIISEEYPEKVKVAYLQGYEQAEKDLALTWEDVQIIWMETEQYMKELRRIERTDLSKFPSSSREIFEEILRRYKEVKK